MEMQIVGIVHVDVDGATYSEGARAGAEHHARQKGVSLSYGALMKPAYARADNCPTTRVSLPYGLTTWGYPVRPLG